ncbi:hypothetical protein FIA58_019445 [Flavobacterium jejuense]|uniref:Uncharacterized protein n=2 Tax=Flavobacterium TaxID=237 RepID=A0ABV5GVJ2_9FLAO|nr:MULTISPECIES: hypothetical protein [Flavobacterium]NHN27858.1 hypothetical protein [Flavobacterium jejuense]
MKKIITLITVLLINTIAFAQAPQKMSYQAVIRDGSDALVVSTTIGMQISILQGSSTGTAVYVETQTPSTNANGLVSIEIGSGSVVSGNFSTIDWSTGNYYIKSETDLAGGTSYTISGTSQLLSVPYAMYAGNAGGGLANGSAIGVSPFWNGTSWVTNNTNFYNNGTNIGLYTTTPTAQLELADIYNAGGKNLQIGDDVYLSDVDVPNVLGIYGVQDSDRAAIKLGSTGPEVWGLNNNIGIGNNNPTAKLDIAGNVKISDGTQGAGKVLTSDANGLATWTDAAPYYHLTNVYGTPSAPFTLGGNGTMVTFAIYNNCAQGSAYGGTMMIDPTGQVTIINYANVLATATMSATGNVISLESGCGTITITLNVSGTSCTMTTGGVAGAYTEVKLTTFRI